jgi:hypothetical protein
MAACLVFMAHPDHDPSEPTALSLLALTLAHRRGVLLCVNGPSRAAGGAGKGGPAGGEQMVARWRAAVEALCAREGLDASLCSVILTDLMSGDGGGKEGRGGEGAGAGRQREEGVHGFRDVEDWVKREAVAFYRMV